MGPGDIGSWSRRGRLALVAAVTVTAVSNSATVAGSYLNPAPAAGLLCGGALLLRHGLPAASPVMTTAAAGVWGWPMLAPLLVALYDLAVRGRALVATACAVLSLLGNAVFRPRISLLTPQQYGPALFLTLALVLGLWAGNRRRLVAALTANVEHLLTERELREQAARLSERSAIAAEMHDVLAHRLTLIALHSGVLTTKKAALPEPMAERVDLLRTACTDGLADLRDVLRALRESGPQGGAEGVAAPVLQEVGEVIEQARTAGQSVEWHSHGSPEQAPSAHRLAVLRLVQEALTNARKHAPEGSVTVDIGYGPPTTLVEVTNTATPQAGPPPPSGFGLVGLAERVEALGGNLEAGPAGTGSWRVAARIPHTARSEQNGVPQ
ncbi:histidine kinase [Streptomyces sp. HNM0575]|uniref:sensor histidine kinase n=1 Tax=Streptomyces sp. HNM0575 TaxID=2716338 RepID=UPI0032167F7B